MIIPVSQMRKMRPRIVTWARSFSLVHGRSGGAKICIWSTAHCTGLCCASSQRSTPLPGRCHPVCFSWPEIMKWTYISEGGLTLSKARPSQSTDQSYPHGHAWRNIALMGSSSSCAHAQPSGPPAADRGLPGGPCFLINVILDISLVLKLSRSPWPLKTPGLTCVRWR